MRKHDNLIIRIIFVYLYSKNKKITKKEKKELWNKAIDIYGFILMLVVPGITLIIWILLWTI